MKIYKERDIDIPRDLNLTELLHQNAGSTPLPESHLIATDSLTNRSITIGELRNRAGRIANGLHKTLKPTEGDRWALILPNCVEYIELFHALLWTGGVGCPINHALKPAEIAHALFVSRPKFIIAYSEALPRIVEGIKIARKQLVSWPEPKILTVVGRVKGYPYIPNDFLDDALPRSISPLERQDNPREFISRTTTSSPTASNSTLTILLNSTPTPAP
jgi:4-coumarate--CoA ligase